jgi:hypothetical protein
MTQSYLPPRGGRRRPKSGWEAFVQNGPAVIGTIVLAVVGVYYTVQIVNARDELDRAVDKADAEIRRELARDPAEVAAEIEREMAKAMARAEAARNAARSGDGARAAGPGRADPRGAQP